MGNEKRHSDKGINQAPSPSTPVTEGVGGRQESTPCRCGGGGYQNIYPVLNFQPKNGQKKRDLRLDDLHKLGLPPVWLSVADAIGADAFLEMWRILDAKGKLTDGGSMIEAKLRPYRSYLRFQRNSYIKALKAIEMSPQQIRKALEKQMSERLSITRITHIAKTD